MTKADIVSKISEKSGTEKAAFLKLWNTGKSIALIGVDDQLIEEVKYILAHQTPDHIENNAVTSHSYN